MSPNQAHINTTILCQMSSSSFPPITLSSAPTKMAAISFASSLHASASPRPLVSRNTPGHILYSRFTPSFSFPSLSFTLRDTVRSRCRPFLIVSAVKSLTETELLPITEADSIPSDSGVYAVYDKSDELQFVGISRNIAASVSAHLKSVPELCGSVKVKLYLSISVVLIHVE